MDNEQLISSAFEPEPILYLEFIENKDRIRQDCKFKNYKPVKSTSPAKNIPPPHVHSTPPPPTATTDTPTPTTAPPAPALDDIAPGSGGGGGIGASGLSYPTEEDESVQKERNDLFFRYQILKRIHPNADIPEYTPYADPKIMAKKYEIIAKKLNLESSVESWKMYMIVFMMGCEVVLGKLSFDMEGFGQQQIMAMDNYDALLLELAEKNYTPAESKWPVELRLIGMVVMNITIFVVAKMIAKKTGINMFDTINNLVTSHRKSSQTTTTSTATAVSATAAAMKGPASD